MKTNIFITAFNDKDGVFRVVVLRAQDSEDARHCIGEWWEQAKGLQVALLSEPERFADLPVGVMKDISSRV